MVTAIRCEYFFFQTAATAPVLDVCKSHFSESVAGFSVLHMQERWPPQKQCLGGCPGHKHRCVPLAMTLLAGTQVWGRKQFPKATPRLWQEMIARNGAKQMLKSMRLSRQFLEDGMYCINAGEKKKTQAWWYILLRLPTTNFITSLHTMCR